jgi:hypothetical protein
MLLLLRLLLVMVFTVFVHHHDHLSNIPRAVSRRIPRRRLERNRLQIHVIIRWGWFYSSIW